MKKKFLVTGGSGFLGSHLCRLLIKKGFSVICLDSFITGNKNNIYDLMNQKNFKLIEHDIIYPIKLKIDGIFNLACAASPIKYQNDPVHTLDTCFTGTKNMLELAKINNAKIFHSSTSEIYGDPEQHPQNENYYGNVNINGPRSCYDEGKRIAETLIYNYNQLFNLDTRVARIFNTYGPGMSEDDGRVVSNFIIAALKNREIIIQGDGSQTRSFCYVDDLINGIYNLYFKKINKKNSGMPVNLGNPKEFTINELAGLVIKLTGSKSKIINIKLPFNDPLKRKPDIKLAKKLIGWNPNYNLKKGLLRTITYFQKQI